MSRRALVILADGFEEIEAVTVLDVLRRGGVETVSAGVTDVHVTGSHGIVIVADAKIADVNGEFDAVVLPGGSPGAENLAASPVVLARIQKMHQAGKIIAAICAAPAVVLTKAGILNGRSATCFPGMEKRFAADTHFKTDAVVVDGNLITSRSAGTALQFAAMLVEKISGKAVADKIRMAMPTA